MTTVYAFHRIEPVTREGDPGRGLAAPVHDPLWGLARQRQFGELSGEDTGSPVKVTFHAADHAIDGWRPVGSPDAALPYDPRRDVLEALVAGEPAGPIVSVRERIDAGRRLAMLAADLADDLRATFPIAAAPEADRLTARTALRFPDGVAIAAIVGGPAGATDAGLAAALSLDAARVAAARPALDAFAGWVGRTFGLGPATWEPTRLERRFELTVEGVPALAAPAHTRDVVDGPDLELTAAAASLAAPDADGRPTIRIPSTLRFAGMPNDRFWEFEDAQLALYRIDAATHDLARLALVEFSTVYGNDWFTFPVPIRAGTVMRLPELVVRDTFGRDELVRVADDATWSMFVATRPAGVAPALIVPAVTVAPLKGPVVEEVAFVRDEQANLVWALERIVTDPGGRIRDLVAEHAASVAPTALLPTDAELLYRLMTDVPDHWVPFIPVHLDAGRRAVGLVEAILPRPTSWGELVEVAPRSTVLAELRGVVLHEEEVPSDGIVVRRQWWLARSADGGRHTWMARSVATGRGEGSSGLAFDSTLDMRAR